jgi:hypothetical protein
VKKFVWLIAVLASVSCGGAFQGATFSLPSHVPTHRITCAVRDQDGAPIPHAICDVEGQAADTDLDGAARFEALPEGARLLDADAPTDRESRPMISYALAAQLLLQPNGVAYVPPFPNSLHRADGTPSQAGDVLSVQPDGSFQTRAADQIGAWETAQREGVSLLYSGTGVTFLVVPVQG